MRVNRKRIFRCGNHTIKWGFPWERRRSQVNGKERNRSTSEHNANINSKSHKLWNNFSIQICFMWETEDCLVSKKLWVRTRKKKWIKILHLIQMRENICDVFNWISNYKPTNIVGNLFPTPAKWSRQTEFLIRCEI